MSTEKGVSKSTIPDADGNVLTEEGKQVTTGSVSPVRPPLQIPVSSPSTEESISAFIKRTVSSLELPSQESEITDLPAPSVVTFTATSHAALLKVSVSEPIVATQDFSTEKSALDNNAETTSQLQTGPLYADTSDVEELMDSSGVDAFPPVTTTMAWDPAAFPEFEGKFQNETGHSDTEQAQYRARVANADRQLTVKGRSVIRKCLTETAHVQLPAGHTTVAFNEDQVHTIRSTIADESVISFCHMMKSLLLHATG